MRHRLAAVAALAAAAAAGAMSACTEVGTSPDAVVALAFDSLPFPAVVRSDSMRDSLGRVSAFHAIAYNAAGEIIKNPALQYLALDTGVAITNGVFIANTLRSGSVRVVAAARSLQSPVRNVVVTRAPSRLSATKVSDTLKYALPDVASANVVTLSAALTGDSAGTALPVAGWLVSWQVLFRGQVVPKTDTTFVSLFDDQSHVSIVDTTGTDGSASRKLRLRANTLPATSDSMVVLATARYKGVVVAGSPLRFVIHFRPKSTAR